ncbi:rRNA cytosine-C5-methylase [Alphaproteobacteria bacterium]|nr:rRNA cytosine-C5-methylase [Alphaproteobacteria bacterium]
MKLTDRIYIVTDLLDTFFHSLTPFDVVLQRFFKANRWIGASERRDIVEYSYSIFRKFETLKLYAENITTDYGKYFVMAYMKLEEKISDLKIVEAFYDRNVNNWKFSDFDAKFLKTLDRQLDLPRHVRLNYPQWLEPYLVRAFSEEHLEKEMLELNQKALVDLRVNTLKSDKDTVKAMLGAHGFQASDTKFAPNGLRLLNARIGRGNPVLKDGLAEIQDEGSQLIAAVCNASSSDMVIDLCAGAGGKTLALAADMQNKGRILALDTNVVRLSQAKLRLRKAGVNNVFCNEITGKWLKRHAECADIVLVDAPCSGTGTWRRNPDMRTKMNENDIRELLVLQQKILEAAQHLVKKGGRLIYATCSVLMEENEDQVEKFLEKFPSFERKNISFDEIDAKTDGISLCRDGYLRLSPANHGTDGFFAACLQLTN